MQTVHCERCEQVTAETLSAILARKYQQCDEELFSLGDILPAFPHISSEIRARCRSAALAKLVEQRPLLEQQLREYLTAGHLKRKADPDDWPVHPLNEGIHLAGLEYLDMDLLPLRELVRDVQYQHFTHLCALHPARRKLWHWFDFSLMPLGDPDINCGHCTALVHQHFYDNNDNYTFDIDDYSEPEEEETVLNYKGETVSIWKVSDGETFGDDPPYYPALSLEEFCFGSGWVCWRFLVTDCVSCKYQVAPSPFVDDHCLACYFFLTVLNELVACQAKRFCPASCLKSTWNQGVKQWPYRCISK